MTRSFKTMINFSAVVLTVAMLISAIQLFYLFTPMKYWIEYKSVEPLHDVKVGESPKFRSIVETYRKANIKFNDILFCKFEGEEEFDYYVNYKSKSYGKKPVGLEKNEWTFHPAVPLVGECYCKSNIILQLPFGISRVQSIKGDVFKITD